MTAKASPAPAAAGTRPSERVADLAGDIRTLWDQSVDWFLTYYLQIGLALIAGAVIVAALWGIRMLGGRLCRPHAGRTPWRTIVGRAITRTHLWFMVALAAATVSGIAQPPAGVQSVIQAAFTIATAFQAAIWARELVLGIVEHRAGDTDHGRLGSAMGIIRLLVTAGLFAIAIVLVLDNLGVNVTGLIAGLGIGGIAIGLAAQGIFADLFAALAIIFDKPFRRGDSIQWDQTSGSVEAIGLKSTRIRSINGEQVVIANKTLLDKELHNYANLDRRRVRFTLGVAYETPADVLDRIPAMVKEVVESDELCKVVRCGLTNFGASTLDIEVQFDVAVLTLTEVWDHRHTVGVALVRRFNEEGIVFAFPSQTNYTAAPDGRLILPFQEATPAAQRHAAE